MERYGGDSNAAEEFVQRDRQPIRRTSPAPASACRSGICARLLANHARHDVGKPQCKAVLQEKILGL
jgi:hypothetical protein